MLQSVPMDRARRYAAFSVLFLALASCHSGPAKPQQAWPPAGGPEWRSLFYGKDLGRWASAEFGGEGQVHVEDGAIVLPMGSPMTGVTWQGELPARIDYEIEWEAQRTLGNDFFCALTFPIGDAPCTWVAAGWGGAIVGLSSLDGMDASQNDTTTFHSFENDRWYRFRLRVQADQVQAWIDEKQVIDVSLQNRRISIRPEVERSRPLGFASWNSEGRIRNIRLRPFQAVR
jgi:hypothetical protein